MIIAWAWNFLKRGLEVVPMLAWLVCCPWWSAATSLRSSSLRKPSSQQLSWQSVAGHGYQSNEAVEFWWFVFLNRYFDAFCAFCTRRVAATLELSFVMFCWSFLLQFVWVWSLMLHLQVARNSLRGIVPYQPAVGLDHRRSALHWQQCHHGHRHLWKEVYDQGLFFEDGYKYKQPGLGQFEARSYLGVVSGMLHSSTTSNNHATTAKVPTRPLRPLLLPSGSRCHPSLQENLFVPVCTLKSSLLEPTLSMVHPVISRGCLV